VVHIPKGKKALIVCGDFIGGTFEFNPAFAMGHGNGKARTGHSPEKEGRGIENFHLNEAGLKLLRAISHKTGPTLGSGNERFELGEHLAAVADTE